jgi:bis(5'-nucleosyl)-tetraphosphatase (symmetrical)
MQRHPADDGPSAMERHPTDDDPSAMQRIFVGDVQGCADELDELLARARDAFGEAFALWCVGDLVNRGPDNRRCLEMLRSLAEEGRARVVLGNHELHLLAVDFGLRELQPEDTFDDVLAANDAREWLDWLRTWPLVIDGTIGDQRFAMLHAAASPDWSLDDLLDVSARIESRLAASADEARALLGADPGEDPLRDALGRLTRCRSVADDGSWSSRQPERPERAWHQAWAARRHEYAIVYGHWSQQGLHVAPGLRGLDTGCVHHGRGRDGFLTAWLPDGAPRPGGLRAFDVPDDRFWQVRAHRPYFGMRAAGAGSARGA